MLIQEVSHREPGKADIYDEISSKENSRFVLHDSKGYEPGDGTNFEIVHKFVLEKCDVNRALKERLHAVWYVTQLFEHSLA